MTGRALVRAKWPIIGVLVLVVLVGAGFRFATDPANIAAGVVPDDSYESRYAEHWWLAYAHIVPGVIYLTGALFQLNRRFRERNFDRHRRLGRVVLPAGLLAGVFGIAFGVPYAFGGVSEALATVVFASWFVVALVLAFRYIRAGDVTRHRRWMIRAFATGLAVGTIRLWVGIFMGFGLLSFENSFAVAFWLAFVMHAVAAEIYLRRWPDAVVAPDGQSQPTDQSIAR